MRNALGAVESALILGGTSDIGAAIAERLAQDRLRRVVLGVRDPGSARATDVAARLRAAGVSQVELVHFDAEELGEHAGTVADARSLIGDLDIVLISYGILGEQATYDDDSSRAALDAAANYAGTVSCGLAAAAALREQGHGTIILLSSVAAERARTSNFVYGSAKAGADAFAQGLGDALIGTGARVMVVRPGFVHSRMTEGMSPQPFATTPDVVANAVADGLRRGREIIWVPGVLRYVFAVLRHLPRPLWRIVSAR